jgi:hypothetical protein
VKALWYKLVDMTGSTYHQIFVFESVPEAIICEFYTGQDTIRARAVLRAQIELRRLL